MNKDATKLLYLEDFNAISAEAEVTSVEATDEGLVDVILDQTCFYPKGGGQDYDQGVISSESVKFQVEQVFVDEAGVVHHLGKLGDGELKVGDRVELQVDEQRRQLNTRLHSAGHLVDMAVDELGYGWSPGKGAHYPNMAFVEYGGDWDSEQREQIISSINDKVTSYVDAGGKNELKFMTVEEMQQVCRHVPDNLPTNKPSRVVIYRGNFGVPCGGTHVSDLSEVGQMRVKKIKKKDGNLRVSYQLT